MVAMAAALTRGPGITSSKTIGVLSDDALLRELEKPVPTMKRPRISSILSTALPVHPGARVRVDETDSPRALPPSPRSVQFYAARVRSEAESPARSHEHPTRSRSSTRPCPKNWNSWTCASSRSHRKQAAGYGASGRTPRLERASSASRGSNAHPPAFPSSRPSILAMKRAPEVSEATSTAILLRVASTLPC